jgi:hypothetical protein
MDGKDRHKQHDNHRGCGEWDESAKQHKQSADELHHNRRPSEKTHKRHADCVQDADEIVCPSRELCVAMRDKAEPDDQPERYRAPVEGRGQRSDGEPEKRRKRAHAA